VGLVLCLVDLGEDPGFEVGLARAVAERLARLAEGVLRRGEGVLETGAGIGVELGSAR
jgi:hypothetical protein